MRLHTRRNSAMGVAVETSLGLVDAQRDIEQTADGADRHCLVRIRHLQARVVERCVGLQCLVALEDSVNVHLDLFLMDRHSDLRRGALDQRAARCARLGPNLNVEVKTMRRQGNHDGSFTGCALVQNNTPLGVISTSVRPEPERVGKLLGFDDSVAAEGLHSRLVRMKGRAHCKQLLLVQDLTHLPRSNGGLARLAECHIVVAILPHDTNEMLAHVLDVLGPSGTQLVPRDFNRAVSVQRHLAQVLVDGSEHQRV
mmetsp:Transcript_2270/g.5318  ORF Transcript_2270/g.5318 Transcript_2270/m.5318 type:complete len:255 (+) Transcript_2270:71-835(+)